MVMKVIIHLDNLHKLCGKEMSRMKEIEFLKFRLRGEFATRIDDSDIVDILEVLQLAEERIEKLQNENQWLYGKLNIISDTIEKGRDETQESNV